MALGLDSDCSELVEMCVGEGCIDGSKPGVVIRGLSWGGVGKLCTYGRQRWIGRGLWTVEKDKRDLIAR